MPLRFLRILKRLVGNFLSLLACAIFHVGENILLSDSIFVSWWRESKREQILHSKSGFAFEP